MRFRSTILLSNKYSVKFFKTFTYLLLTDKLYSIIIDLIKGDD